MKLFLKYNYVKIENESEKQWGFTIFDHEDVEISMVFYYNFWRRIIKTF